MNMAKRFLKGLCQNSVANKVAGIADHFLKRLVHALCSCSNNVATSLFFQVWEEVGVGRVLPLFKK